MRCQQCRRSLGDVVCHYLVCETVLKGCCVHGSSSPCGAFARDGATCAIIRSQTIEETLLFVASTYLNCTRVKFALGRADALQELSVRPDPMPVLSFYALMLWYGLVGEIKALYPRDKVIKSVFQASTTNVCKHITLTNSSTAKTRCH